ncbi:MAG: beta-propeller fold lactonase family protein, partial [Rhizobiales bacterium]|nr:beta-propeller fold lactonase family protein [Hyphomicrobiales bacterium]
NGKIISQIPVGKSPSGLDLSPDGKWLYSTDRDDSQVSVIDTNKNKVTTTIKTGIRPFGITVNKEGTLAYTANVKSHDVSILDLTTNKLIKSVKVGNRPYAVALAKGKAFVSDQYNETVSVNTPKAWQPAQREIMSMSPVGFLIS